MNWLAANFSKTYAALRGALPPVSEPDTGPHEWFSNNAIWYGPLDTRNLEFFILQHTEPDAVAFLRDEHVKLHPEQETMWELRVVVSDIDKAIRVVGPQNCGKVERHGLRRKVQVNTKALGLSLDSLDF